MSRFSDERLDPANYPQLVEIPVLYGDLDPNNHVNNVSMGRFFEHARFTSVAQILGQRLIFLVARVAIDYTAEAHFGTPIVVATRLGGRGRTSLTVEQVARQSETVVAVCETVIVHHVDSRPTPLPLP